MTTPAGGLPPTLFRDFAVTIDRAALDARAEGDDRIPLAISSEYGVERQDWMTGERYVEVLDHAASAVDLTRARDGLPLLLDHNTRTQVGIVEDVLVGPDRKLRGVARFSRGQQGQEVRGDVMDGIRRNISVGYVTGDDFEQSTNDAGQTVRRYRRWTPYEVSSVPIPADPTVGIGRAADPQGGAPAPAATAAAPLPPTADEARSSTMSDVQTPVAAAPAIEARERAPQGITREQAIATIAEAAGVTVAQMRGWQESGKSVAEVSAEAFKLATGERAPAAMPSAKPAVEDYSDGKREFSLATAVRASVAGNWAKAGYERSVSDDLARRVNQDLPANTFLMPTVKRLSDEEIQKRAVHVTSSATLGGNAVFAEYGGFIDILRNYSAVAQMGATVLPGLRGNVSFVKQTQAGSVYWLAENPGSDVTQSNMTFSQITLSPKTMMAQQAVSNKLLAQADINTDAVMRNDLARVIGLEWDRVGLHGSGASNQPTGLYALSGVNAEAFGSATVTYPHIVAMAQKIVTANANVGQIKYLATPETAAKALQVQRFTSTDSPLWSGTLESGSLVGYNATTTNQLSKTLGAGSEHGFIAGVWSELMYGEWGAVALTVDPLTLAGQDLVRLIVRQFVDIQARYPEAFTKATALIP